MSLSLGDGNAPGYLHLANIWMIVNQGGGPTPDKQLWKNRGAEFITEPVPKYGEIRCYIRDPDEYIIEVGQSTNLTYG